MVFSSAVFLFAFMPLFFGIYYLTPAFAKNFFIFAASTLFYAVAGGYLTLILLISIALNYGIAHWIVAETIPDRRLLVAGIVVNLAPLVVYKYLPFMVSAAGDGARLFGLHLPVALKAFVIPAGISFYTFHSISYLVDVYKRKVEPSRSLIDFGMYMICFPQLIAGPIVRYAEVVARIPYRPVVVEEVYSGIGRFVLGLSKKIIIADTVGRISDQIFALPSTELTTGLAWLGIVSYTLQIYFDFSGYSDMAIGMGRMMGFAFPENFDQPYRSKSITEFWRRWHMTLSRWFRDYVYIPMGGNQKGAFRTYVNLCVVFFLCGAWHGANYTFILWGLYHGLLLVIERVLKNRFNFAPAGLAGQGVTLLLVAIGWVFFRSDSLAHAAYYLAAMFHLGPSAKSMFGPAFYLTPDKCVFLLVGVVCAVAPFEKLRRFAPAGHVTTGVEIAVLLMLLVQSASMIAANGFNPFIYFRF
ncbi:MBOAT family O-acyltransferase [Paraburkholderia acidiphila]|uniref:Probable alginate O-acetylase AlgI n=1 Tax=Paraburkholderia acidiphila TaxID=2571747 RepID=A0A7Z2J8F7_9BURK|nr:MBOAT family protein [Paraburkholderia acidiphila]QGZ54005.1 MBOAT family protein [Paraburkholderia acidiphila]